MKNRLLVMMALFGAASVSMPAWAEDKYPDPELKFVAPNLTQDGTGGGKYYIYHVATKKFMNNGNWEHDWNTELAVADEGKVVTLSWGKDYELSRRPLSDPLYHDHSGWRFSMMDAPTNGGFHELFIPAELCIAVDHSKQGHILWDIVPQADGSYRIRILAADPTYGIDNTSDYGNAWCYVTQGAHGLGVNPLFNIESELENFGGDWKFVAPADYPIYVAKMAFKAKLEEAAVAAIPNLADYEAIYNSTTATPEDYEEATEDIVRDMLQFKYSSASEDHPADVSDLITNAKLEKNANGWTTWRADNSNNFQWQGGRTDIKVPDGDEPFTNFFERWKAGGANQGSWHMIQDLKDLPDGKYSLTARIFNNIQKATAEDPGPKGIFLRARTLNGTTEIEATTPSPDGSAYAYAYTIEFSVLGGTATIGVYAEDPNQSWAGAGYFTLLYKGTTGATTMKEALQNAVTDAETKYEGFVTDYAEAWSLAADAKYQSDIKDAKDLLLASDVKDDTYQKMILNLAYRMDTLNTDIQAYATLDSKLTEVENTIDDDPIYQELGEDNFTNFWDCFDENFANPMDARTFDPALLDSFDVWMNRARMMDVSAGLVAGLTNNVTALLQNPDFSDGKNGWKGFASDGQPTVNSGVAEGWQTTFDVYQELTDLPQGSYEVSFFGFYRPGSNVECQKNWGNESWNTVMGYLYGNETMQPFVHVYSTLYDKNIMNNCSQLNDIADPEAEALGKWALNGLASADSAFNKLGDFKATAKFYVKEDGKLRIGATIPQAPGWGDYWCAFDNFQITYLGADDASGLIYGLDIKIQEAQAQLANTAMSVQETKTNLTNVITAANNADRETMTVEECQKLLADLDEAIAADREAVNKVIAFSSVWNNYDAFQMDQDNYDKYGDADAWVDLEDLLTDTQDYVEELAIFDNVAQIDAEIVKMNELYGLMLTSIISGDGASISDPVDVTAALQNPGFDESTSWVGWTQKGAAVVDLYANDNSVVDQGNMAEIYNSEDGFVSQIVYGMPKGYYRLNFNGFYRAGTTNAGALARRDSTEEQNTEVFVTCGEQAWSTPLPSIMEHISEYKYLTNDAFIPDTMFTEPTGRLYHIVSNKPAAAKLAFNEGAYKGTLSFEVATEGQPIELGVRKVGHIGSDWTCFDNFELWYLGVGEENKPGDFNTAIEEVAGAATVVKTTWYTVSGIKVPADAAKRGLYIRQDEMSDGTTKSAVVVK